MRGARAGCVLSLPCPRNPLCTRQHGSMDIGFARSVSQCRRPTCTDRVCPYGHRRYSSSAILAHSRALPKLQSKQRSSGGDRSVIFPYFQRPNGRSARPLTVTRIAEQLMVIILIIHSWTGSLCRPKTPWMFSFFGKRLTLA